MQKIGPGLHMCICGREKKDQSLERQGTLGVIWGLIFSLNI